MTRIVAVSVFVYLLSSSLVVAADPFVGKWVNTDEMTGGVTRLEVEKKGDGWAIQAWGKCHPTDCDWGKAPLHLLADFGDTEMKYGLAHWDAGFSEKHATLRADKGELVVETYTVYKDKSGRSNYRSKYTFKNDK